jgi:hypothetical protein
MLAYCSRTRSADGVLIRTRVRDRGESVARTKLTKRLVDAAHYTGSGRSPCLVWDGQTSGFGLRIHPTGRKAFVLRYRNREGRQRWATLGPYGVLTVEQARRKALALLAEVLEGDI